MVSRQADWTGVVQRELREWIAAGTGINIQDVQPYSQRVPPQDRVVARIQSTAFTSLSQPWFHQELTRDGRWEEIGRASYRGEFIVLFINEGAYDIARTFHAWTGTRKALDMLADKTIEFLGIDDVEVEDDVAVDQSLLFRSSYLISIGFVQETKLSLDYIEYDHVLDRIDLHSQVDDLVIIGDEEE